MVERRRGERHLTTTDLPEDIKPSHILFRKLSSARTMLLIVACFFTTMTTCTADISSVPWDTTCEATQYYDSTNMYCAECTEGCSVDSVGDNCFKEPDYDYTDPYGNALQCKCKSGYEKRIWWAAEYDDADGDWPTGENVGFTCSLAHGGTEEIPAGDTTAFSDGSGSTACSRSTSGLKTDATGTGTLGDCYCGTEATDGGFRLRVLVETTGGGEYKNKSCVSCGERSAVVTTAGVYAGIDYGVDYYSCQRCPDPHMDMSADRCASCHTGAGYASEPEGLVAVGPLFCVYEKHRTYITTTYDTEAAYEVKYTKVQADAYQRPNGVDTVEESYTLRHYFINASANCYFYKGPENLANCQTLANLCVLVMYDTTHPACEAFKDIEAARPPGYLQQNGWGAALPWLYYETTAPVVRSDASIDMILGFSKAADVDASRLTFYLSVFALNGTWLGMQELGTQFFYCGSKTPKTERGGGSSSSTAWLNYGNDFRGNYRCDLETLIDKEPLFYELFVADEGAKTDDGIEASLHPCPVLLKDYEDEDSGKVNHNPAKSNMDDDVFVRRFMLYDVYTGVMDGYTGALNGGGGYPYMIRYAKLMKLVITAHENDASRIYPPILEITYQERKPEQGGWDKIMRTDALKFQVEYSQDRSDEDYTSTFTAFFTITSVAAGITTLFRLSYWTERNQRVPSKKRRNLDMGLSEYSGFLANVGNDAMLRGRDCEPMQRGLRSYFWTMIIMVCHVFSLYNFLLIFALCTCFFVFFKMQSNDMAAFMLLPPRNGDWEDGEENPYKFIWVLLYCCFWSQTVFVAQIIYVQCTTEIFFVDMENPSKRTGQSGLGPPGRRQELVPLTNSRSLGQSGVTGGGGGTGSNAFDPGAEDGVSAWRRILVANEWNKLGCTRRTSLEFTLIWMAFILIGQDIQYVALPHPDINNHYSKQCGDDDNFHMLLRFASHTWWFAVLELIQIGFQEFCKYLDSCTHCYTAPYEMRGQHFIDLCTWAKVSVVVLDEAYHGYVLYCDSSTTSADTNLKNLTSALLRETEQMNTRQGPADLADLYPGVQAFELYISDGWLKWYKNHRHKLEDMARKLPAAEAVSGGAGAGSHRPIHRVPRGVRRGDGGCFKTCCTTLEQRNRILSVNAMEIMNDKLKKFLRKQLGDDLKWEPADPWQGEWSSWLYRRIRRPPVQVRNSENILVPDIGNRFTSLTLYGIEWELWLQNVLTMAICDIWFDNTATSLFCVYIVYQGFRTARSFFGEQNLSDTSLVQKEFLV